MKKINFGALLGDSFVYHNIPTSCKPLSTRIEEKEFQFEKEERDQAYLKSRVGNKSLSVFEDNRS